MVDAITTYSATTPTFIVNKYDDIDGGQVAQSTPRGRLCFRDTDGRFVLPRTIAESRKAVYPVDHGKPLNGPPYFDGVGLNGQPPNAFSDGSIGASESTFALDPNQAFLANWPVGYKIYDIPPLFYDLPIASGNRNLVYDGESTLTFGSGNYVGVPTDYGIGSKVYAAYTSGNEGKLTVSGGASGEVAVGLVVLKDVYGTNSITVKTFGSPALG